MPVSDNKDKPCVQVHKLNTELEGLQDKLQSKQAQDNSVAATTAVASSQEFEGFKKRLDNLDRELAGMQTIAHSTHFPSTAVRCGGLAPCRLDVCSWLSVGAKEANQPRGTPVCC